MDHPRAGCERVELAGHTVVKARADGDQQVAALRGRGGGDGAVHAEHSERLGVRVRHDATGRERGDDRRAGHFGQFGHFGGRVGTHRATAHVQHGTVRLREQLRRIRDHAAVRLRGGVVTGQNHALRPRIIHLAGLRGLGQVHDHRAGAARTGDIVRLGEHAGDILCAGHQIRVLDDRIGRTNDVRLLEGVGADGVHAHLTGDHDERHGIHVRVGDWGDHVRRARAGRDDAHAHAACRHRIAFGGMAGGLLVAYEREPELRIVVDRVEHRQDGAAGQAEHVLHAQILQRANQRLRAGHFLTVDDRLLVCGCGVFRNAAERLQWCG